MPQSFTTPERIIPNEVPITSHRRGDGMSELTYAEVISALRTIVGEVPPAPAPVPSAPAALSAATPEVAAAIVEAARAAGMISPHHAATLIKPEDVTLDDWGRPNAAELVAVIKAHAPDLFPAPPEPPAPPVRDVRQLSPAEYAAAKREAIRAPEIARVREADARILARQMNNRNGR